MTISSKFSFLRRVRIHDGECGAVARALHHAVTGSSLYQADLEMVSRSTHERKQMSTKTTLKRIAFVAVSALGFGLLSVAPAAQADEATVAEVTAVSIATPTGGRIGSPFTSQVTFTTVSAAASDTVTLRAVMSRPVGSTATVGFNTVGLNVATSVTETAAITAAGASGNELLPIKLVVSLGNAPANSSANIAGRVGFTPDVAGDYVITVWHDIDGDGVQDPSTVEKGDTDTFTVGSAPTSVTISATTGAAPASSIYGSNGQIVKIGLPAGSALAADESLTVAVTGTGVTVDKINGSTSGAQAASVTLNGSSFLGGFAWLNVKSTSATTSTLTVTGSGTAVAGLSSTASLTFKAVDAAQTSTRSFGDSGVDGFFEISTSFADTATVLSTAAQADARTGDILVPLGSQSVSLESTYTAGAAADAYVACTIADTDGRVLGTAALGLALSYDKAVLVSGTTTITSACGASATFTAAGQYFSLSKGNGTDTTSVRIISDLPDLDGGSVTVSPTSLAAKTGGSVQITATIADQFGNEAGTSARLAISGRNATVAATERVASVTDGVAVFTYTDAPAAGVTSLTDSVTITALDIYGNDLAASAMTITWSATGPVAGTVTILGGNNSTTTGVAATSPSWKDINAGSTGAQATTHTAVATVKDASGNLMVGVPVVFTVSGTTAAITSTTQTVYTGSAGTATANVYAWVAGSYTVTATVGAVTGTAVYQFRQSAAGEERAISASVDGAVVTAIVVDRFGNGVPSVTVYATKTGAGYFGSGTTRTSGATDNNGEVSFVITGGAAEVTVATYDASTATAPLGSGQTCAAEGKVSCAATATAITAYVAGTSTVAETGVGSSLAAAGVPAATVSVDASAANAASEAATAAADAALEAIDAANAATDAANLAAEAADAATVAAEEARDAADAATAAVEALASEVATLMAALKAQITTLAKTVAKIAKKVKA